MFEVNIAVILIVCLVALVAIGVHIAIALGLAESYGISPMPSSCLRTEVCEAPGLISRSISD